VDQEIVEALIRKEQRGPVGGGIQADQDGNRRGQPKKESDLPDGGIKGRLTPEEAAK
jgi:hypothetical protein